MKILLVFIALSISLVGIILWLFLPIPGGFVVFLIGLVMLICSSERTTRLLQKLRCKYKKINKAFIWFESNSGLKLRKILKRTKPIELNRSLLMLKNKANANELIQHYRVCNYCEAMCGVAVTYNPTAESDLDKIRVKPDKKDPFSQGSMCPKASALGPLHLDPEKLRQPVKKQDGQWIEISWQEAYDTIEKNIKANRGKSGVDSIATYLGNPIVHNLGMMVFVKSFTKAIGSKNIYSATSMDQLPHHFAAHYMFGHELRIPVPDIDRTDHMIIMGANPLASNGSIMTSAGVRKRLNKIEEKGGKFIVIDPRKTETAKIATEHYFIKPGTDVFFLLAFLHIIYRDKKVKFGYLEKHIVGHEKIESLVKEFAPEKVAQITSIEPEIIQAIVSEFLEKDRAVLYGRMGLSTQKHGGLCHWLINLINIVSGNFDKAGGMMFPTPAIEVARDLQKDAFGRWKSRVRKMNEFAGELPVSTMVDELVTQGEGQVKTYITVCGNPVLSSPDGKRLDKALENIDFMFSIDNYINETTRHADIILPTPSGLEIDHYDLIFNLLSVTNNAKFSEALFDKGESRPFDWQVLKELSKRISINKMSIIDKITTPRRLVNWGLMLGPYGKLSSPKRWFTGLSLKKLIKSKHGINLGPLQPAVPMRLNTHHKKIILTPYVFVDHLKKVKKNEWMKLLQTPLSERSTYQFLLIGRRNVNTNNSWMHQVEKLNKSKQVRCTVMMNPVDADTLQVFNGENLKVSSRIGEIILPVEITDSMMSGVVSIPHGFGHNKKDTRVSIASLKPGVSVNDITDPMKVDALTGNAAFSGLVVNIKKVNSKIKKSKKASGKPITILYASQSGNAEIIAYEVAQEAKIHGLLPQIVSMDNIDLNTLSKNQRIVIIVSTFGEGDMPDSAEKLWQQISESYELKFKNSHYAVLALGDVSYDNYCQAGLNWDKRLEELGAKRLLDIVKCDVDYIASSDNWKNEVLPLISTVGNQKVYHQDEKSIIIKPVKYNRENPIALQLHKKKVLTTHDCSRQIIHYEFRIPDENINYEVGDTVYLIPKNSRDLVNQFMSYFFNADTPTSRLDLSDIRNNLLNNLEIRTPSIDSLKVIIKNIKDCKLACLIDNQSELEDYLWGKDLLDILLLYPKMKAYFKEIYASLKPIVARAYSISSSRNKHQSTVHLTIATVKYQTHERNHSGMCSGYLANELAVGKCIDGYFVSNKHFSVPKNDKVDIIMIGPGTGIAPFRGFLQERHYRKATGKNWLFFGNRNKNQDFLYQKELQEMQASGLLNKLDLAFSRDQTQKIYVQDKMQENAKEFFNWLESGAYLYVCGDSKKMAKDVEIALQDIIQKQGQLDSQQGLDYINNLKKQKRYVKDVY